MFNTIKSIENLKHEMKITKVRDLLTYTINDRFVNGVNDGYESDVKVTCVIISNKCAHNILKPYLLAPRQLKKKQTLQMLAMLFDKKTC